MLFGIGLAWLLTPMFMPRDTDAVLRAAHPLRA